MDKSKPRTFIYHSDEDPKIVYVGEEQEWYDKGWEDSPAKCKGFLGKVGIDARDEIGIQVLGAATEDIKDEVNVALNLNLLTVKELKVYAKKHGIKHYKNATKKQMLKLIG